MALMSAKLMPKRMSNLVFDMLFVLRLLQTQRHYSALVGRKIRVRPLDDNPASGRRRLKHN
jgi:hypothetical protein